MCAHKLKCSKIYMVRSYKEWIRIRLIAIVSSLKITDNITERRLGVAPYTYSQHRKIAHCTKTICQHLSIPNLHITFDKSNWEDHTTVQDTTVPFHVQLVTKDPQGHFFPSVLTMEISYEFVRIRGKKSWKWFLRIRTKFPITSQEELKLVSWKFLGEVIQTHRGV